MEIGLEEEKEFTLFLVKSDGVRRKLTSQVLAHLPAGLRVKKTISRLTMTKDEAEKFYKEHRGAPFFNELITHITSGPCIAMMVVGDNVVQRVRDTVGPTRNAPAGTIRGDLGNDKDLIPNVAHSSANPEAALRELRIVGLL